MEVQPSEDEQDLVLRLVPEGATEAALLLLNGGLAGILASMVTAELRKSGSPAPDAQAVESVLLHHWIDNPPLRATCLIDRVRVAVTDSFLAAESTVYDVTPVVEERVKRLTDRVLYKTIQTIVETW